jgi:hypothetical protein
MLVKILEVKIESYKVSLAQNLPQKLCQTLEDPSCPLQSQELLLFAPLTPLPHVQSKSVPLRFISNLSLLHPPQMRNLLLFVRLRIELCDCRFGERSKVNVSAMWRSSSAKETKIRENMEENSFPSSQADALR